MLNPVYNSGQFSEKKNIREGSSLNKRERKSFPPSVAEQRRLLVAHTRHMEQITRRSDLPLRNKAARKKKTSLYSF